MLTEKDYCDYDTCVALKELGFDENCLAYYDSEDNVGLLYNEEYSSAFYPVQYTDLLKSHNARPNGCIDAPTLYEAQKWLREEKSIYVTVGCPLIMNEGLGWSYEVCDKPWNGYSDDDCVKASGGAYDSYEEALSEGIKQSVKILKEKR